jgi:hypothetical protein
MCAFVGMLYVLQVYVVFRVAASSALAFESVINFKDNAQMSDLET